MPPVIVCVVDTGMPCARREEQRDAAPVSAHMPPTGWSRVIFEPIVFTMRQPPVSVPSAIAVCAERTTQSGTSALGRTFPVRDEQARGSRPSSSARRCRRGRGCTPRPRRAGRAGSRLLSRSTRLMRWVDQSTIEHQREADREAEQRRDHDEHRDQLEAAPDERAEAGLGHRGAGHPTDERVRARRGQAEPEREQAPARWRRSARRRSRRSTARPG